MRKSLFEYLVDGCYIGVENIRTGETYYHLYNETDPENDWQIYDNENFCWKFGGWQIKKIIMINNEGMISKVIWERQKELPELKTGMIVYVDVNNKKNDWYEDCADYGIIVNDYIIYQKRGYDHVKDIVVDTNQALKDPDFDGLCLTKIWSKDIGCYGFDAVKDAKPIWTFND